MVPAGWAVVRFVSDVAGTTVDKVAESIEDQVRRRVGGGHAPDRRENNLLTCPVRALDAWMQAVRIS
ncbi:MAG TPA: hypothetical protein VK988_13640 [Acidimicrobiales bacterium]|nr:hypothetical protein [Acidimicrobiales bacterium]